jgi:hypothetical protein
VKKQKAGSREEQSSSVALPSSGSQVVNDEPPSGSITTVITPTSSQDGGQIAKRSSVASEGLYDRIADRREEPTWLVRQQNKSRYISNNFWASMTREVALMPLTIL